MLKKNVFLLMLLALVSLAGCATNAGVSQMTADAEGLPAKPKNSQFVHNIGVQQVSGGHETNPLWTSQINNENFKQALKISLINANLYNKFSGENSKYMLNAQLIKLEQPLIGLDFTVNCEVHYDLKDVKTNKVIFNKNIASSYTATVSDAFVAGERLKLANEGAARTNIKKLIEDLYQLEK